jgi:hypothetical protein
MGEGDLLMLSSSEWLYAARGDDEATYSCRSEDGGRSWHGLQRLTRDRNGGDTLLAVRAQKLCLGGSRKFNTKSLYTIYRGVQITSLGARIASAGGDRLPRGEHPPDLTLLSGGAVLLWFGVRSAPDGRAGVQGRLSFDRGRSWGVRRLTLTDVLPGPDSTYPSTAQLEDGTLCTVYYTARIATGGKGMFHTVLFFNCHLCVETRGIIYGICTKRAWNDFTACVARRGPRRSRRTYMSGKMSRALR